MVPSLFLSVNQYRKLPIQFKAIVNGHLYLKTKGAARKEYIMSPTTDLVQSNCKWTPLPQNQKEKAARNEYIAQKMLSLIHFISHDDRRISILDIVWCEGRDINRLKSLFHQTFHSSSTKNRFINHHKYSNEKATWINFVRRISDRLNT